MWCKLSSLNDKLLHGPDLDNNAVGDLALASSKTCCHHVYQSHISIGQDSKNKILTPQDPFDGMTEIGAKTLRSTKWL